MLMIQVSKQNPLPYKPSRSMAKMALDALESEDVFVQRHPNSPGGEYPSPRGRSRGQGYNWSAETTSQRVGYPDTQRGYGAANSPSSRGSEYPPVDIDAYPEVHKPRKPSQSRRRGRGRGRGRNTPAGRVWHPDEVLNPGNEPGTRWDPPRMRPAPSDQLPLDPLHFLLDQNTIPPRVELDTKKLKKILGDGFNADYMSVTEPRELQIRPNGTLDYSPGHKGFPIRDMDAELKSLTVRIPGRVKKLKIRGERTKKRVLRFLSAYSYCPVQYQWKDMGVNVWPRWLKEGTCYQGRSCSIPPGMTCQPARSTSLSVLYWHCKRKQACKWIQIQYSIITECACAC